MRKKTKTPKTIISYETDRTSWCHKSYRVDLTKRKKETKNTKVILNEVINSIFCKQINYPVWKYKKRGCFKNNKTYSLQTHTFLDYKVKKINRRR